MDLRLASELSTISARLSYLRKRSGATQKFICESTGVSQSNLSKYERNIVQPTADALIALCKFYKVSSDWLLFGYEHKQSERGSDLELERMYTLLQKMMLEDADTRSWAKKQFEYSFKPFIEEEEKKDQQAADVHRDAG